MHSTSLNTHSVSRFVIVLTRICAFSGMMPSCFDLMKLKDPNKSVKVATCISASCCVVSPLNRRRCSFALSSLPHVTEPRGAALSQVTVPQVSCQHIRGQSLPTSSPPTPDLSAPLSEILSLLTCKLQTQTRGWRGEQGRSLKVCSTPSSPLALLSLSILFSHFCPP